MVAGYTEVAVVRWLVTARLVKAKPAQRAVTALFVLYGVKVEPSLQLTQVMFNMMAGKYIKIFGKAHLEIFQ